MIDFRCSNCNKLLGRIYGSAEIKCSKCKTMNILPREQGMWIDADGFIYVGKNRMGWVAPKDRHLERPPIWDKPESYYQTINM